MNEHLIGRWALCDARRLGKIVSMRVSGRRTTYYGTGIDGQPWQSSIPFVVGEADSKRLDAVIEVPSTPDAP